MEQRTHSRPKLPVKPAAVATLTPIPVEDLQKEIVAIGEGMRKLNASRLRRRTIILLLHDHSGVGKRDIETVLNSLDVLEATYLKPTVKVVA